MVDIPALFRVKNVVSHTRIYYHNQENVVSDIEILPYRLLYLVSDILNTIVYIFRKACPGFDSLPRPGVRQHIYLLYSK